MCPDYDLCQDCYDNGFRTEPCHLEHSLFKIVEPVLPMDEASSRDITAESLTEALAAISFGKSHTSTNNSEVNLDIMTEEEQIAYATKMSIQPESD